MRVENFYFGHYEKQLFIFIFIIFQQPFFFFINDFVYQFGRSMQ